MPELNRAYSLLEIKSAVDDGEERILTGIASTVSADRMGDIVVPEGAKFMLPLPLLHQHNSAEPIGEVVDAKVNGKQITVTARIAKDTGLDYVETAWKQIKAKLVKGFSIGFRTLKHEPLDPDKPWAGYKFLEWEWMELSTVTLPANAQATITAVKSYADRPVADTSAADRTGETFGKSAVNRPKRSTQHSGVSVMPKASDRVDTLSREIVTLKDSVNEIMKACEAEGREPTEDEAAEVAVAEETIAMKQKAVDTYKAAERALATKAAAQSPSIIRAQSKSREPGDFLVKTAVTKLFAHINRSHPLTEAERLYGRDQEAVEVIKSSIAPAQTTVPAWAGDLTRQDTRGFMDLLKEASAYARLAALGMQLDFAGASSVKVPGRAATPNVAGSFTAEGGLIPVKKLGFTSTTLAAYKMAVISTFTREILEQSTPNIETIVRQAMVDDTAVAIDTALFSANPAVAGVSPAGIEVGANAVASGGATVQLITGDVKAALARHASQKTGRRLVWVMNPARIIGLSFLQTAAGAFMFADELRSGRFMGLPVISSNNVPAAKVYLIDAADFISAFDAPMFSVSDQATIVEVDDDGTDPTTSGGGLADISDVTTGVNATPAANVRSLYQTDSSALRMIMPLSWAQFRGSVHVINTVTW